MPGHNKIQQEAQGRVNFATGEAKSNAGSLATVINSLAGSFGAASVATDNFSSSIASTMIANRILGLGWVKTAEDAGYGTRAVYQYRDAMRELEIQLGRAGMQIATPFINNAMPSITNLTNYLQSPEGMEKVNEIAQKAFDTIEGIGRIIAIFWNLGSMLFNLIDAIAYSIGSFFTFGMFDDEARAARGRVSQDWQDIKRHDRQLTEAWFTHFGVSDKPSNVTNVNVQGDYMPRSDWEKRWQEKNTSHNRFEGREER